MAGTIVDFFGYVAEDDSQESLSAVAKNLCPFIHDTCTKVLGRDGPALAYVPSAGDGRRLGHLPARYAFTRTIIGFCISLLRRHSGVGLGCIPAERQSRKRSSRAAQWRSSGIAGAVSSVSRSEAGRATISPIGCSLLLMATVN